MPPNIVSEAPSLVHDSKSSFSGSAEKDLGGSFPLLKISFSFGRLWSFKTIRTNFVKISNVASHVFSGLRSARDFVDPHHTYFSKRFAVFVSYSSTVDCVFFPSQVLSVVKNVLSLFAMNSVADKIDSLLNIALHARDILQESATVCTILHEISYVSEVAIGWVNKFNVATLFVDFISIGKNIVFCCRIYKLLKSFRSDQRDFHKQLSWELQKETALCLLRKIDEEKEILALDLFLSKKAFYTKIAALIKQTLEVEKEKSTEHLRNIDSFYEVLAKRAKLQAGLSVADIIVSLVSSAGAFVGFLPAFQLMSILVVAGTGVCSFVIWGGRSLLVFKHPFVDRALLPK